MVQSLFQSGEFAHTVEDSRFLCANNNRGSGQLFNIPVTRIANVESGPSLGKLSFEPGSNRLTKDRVELAY